LWWVVTLVQFFRWVTRLREGDDPALCRGCAFVCGPFLRGAPILSADERAELRRLVDAQIPEREGSLAGRVPGDRRTAGRGLGRALLAMSLGQTATPPVLPLLVLATARFAAGSAAVAEEEAEKADARFRKKK
jgi:hypothetical protein